MERYRNLVENWEAFKEKKDSHPTNIARRNDLKASENFEEDLRESFEEVEEVDWNEKVYRLKDTETPGKTSLHWRGEYYVQEESAALPVKALDPEPGEKVLDMCAAPGGKATQIADRMNNEGLVVANDESGQRMKSLHANVYRTGSAVINATNYDGRRIPEDEKFDRILVDAPCSGEGDRFYRGFESASQEEIEGLAKLQKQLLSKAKDLLKEDGVIVYSTCTINPEENEGVVEHGLDEGLELESFEPGFEHVNGVESFEGKEYSKQMKDVVRVYPHHINSGVIFVAKFVNSSDSTEVAKSPGSSETESSDLSSPQDKPEKAMEYLEERFGIEKQDLQGLQLKEVSGDVWLAPEKETGLEKETSGIRAVRFMDIGLKPTTYLLQILGDRISKNKIETDKEEFKTLLEGEMIERKLDEKGYVAVFHDGKAFGCGFYMDELVSSRIPEGRAEELLGTL